MHSGRLQEEREGLGERRRCLNGVDMALNDDKLSGGDGGGDCGVFAFSLVSLEGVKGGGARSGRERSSEGGGCMIREEREPLCSGDERLGAGELGGAKVKVDLREEARAGEGGDEEETANGGRLLEEEGEMDGESEWREETEEWSPGDVRSRLVWWAPEGISGGGVSVDVFGFLGEPPSSGNS